MSEELVTFKVNNCDNNMNAININGITSEDKYRDDCRPMDSNDLMSNINRLEMSPTISDKHSKTSSKSSIKSNASEDRNSIKSQKSDRKSNKSNQRYLLPIKDHFCWDCHKIGVDYSCKTCLRSYHKKCPSLKKLLTELQSCPECIGIMKAEEGTNPSGCMQLLNGNVDRMAELLEYTIITVKTADRNQLFQTPVSTEEYPEYRNLIVNPMDLSLVEENVKNKTYASTNSFLADIKWISHNCFIFNSGGNNSLISDAKNIIRVAKQECEEIEICPDCYLNYYTLEEDNYFAAVCQRPHAIVWAKLKGHPFWPAKVVRYNGIKNEVDIRFFGTHDKCWLKPEKCYLMSKEYPNTNKPSKFDQKKFDDAIRDMNKHLDGLEDKFKGMFKFYPKHTIFTFNNLYLSYEKISKQSEDNYQTNVEQTTERPKNVFNCFNGSDLKLKKLKVNVSTFDNKMFDYIKQKDDSTLEPPLKRLKRSSLKGSPIKSKQKCFSKAIVVREELSSSIESDQSLNDSKDASKIDHLLSPQNSCDMNLKNDFNENHLNSSYSEISDSNISLKCSPIRNQSKTVTVSGKSSEILNLNNLNDSYSNGLTPNSNKLLIDLDSNSAKSDFISNPKIKSPPKRNFSNEELLKKIKSLEFKKRKLEEQLNEANNKITALEEEKDELKKSNDEMIHSISDIKKKQWCTNCSKEGILPCCWNTCYCTVECQYQHWPTHSKICRRRQNQPNPRT